MSETCTGRTGSDAQVTRVFVRVARRRRCVARAQRDRAPARRRVRPPHRIGARSDGLLRRPGPARLRAGRRPRARSCCSSSCSGWPTRWRRACSSARVSSARCAPSACAALWYGRSVVVEGVVLGLLGLLLALAAGSRPRHDVGAADLPASARVGGGNLRALRPRRDRLRRARWRCAGWRRCCPRAALQRCSRPRRCAGSR